jgi:hypothetical protein
MGLQGMMQLQVATDGYQVVDVKLKSRHPVLTPDAIRDVRTWKFAGHTPTTFAVTYLYIHEGNWKLDKNTYCSAKMELLTKVTVSTGHPFPTM